MKKSGEIEEMFTTFKGMNILIIGDVMIDAYVVGNVERISPEAPVPVVSVSKRYNRLGGAANVALNIKSLGATPFLCSVVGRDDRGDDFFDLLRKRGLETSALVRSKDRITTTKFRVIGNNTQMLRVDEEDVNLLNDNDFINICEAVKDTIETKNIKAVIFEDYDKGVIDKRLIDFVVETAMQKGIMITADPKKKNFNFYHDITLFKPNLKELNEGTGNNFDNSDMESIAGLAARLSEEKNHKTVMVTLSEKGILATSGGDFFHVPAELRRIADVSGAGDTVISTVTLALASGMDLKDAVLMANTAGGLVCEQVGVVPVDRENLFAELKKKFK